MTVLERARHHWNFAILVALLIAMTWPAAFHIFAMETAWFPSGDHDIWMKFWDAWHLERMLAGEAGYLWTDSLFHPAGLSLTYHNFNLPHMALLSGLGKLLPASSAYNLVFLLILVVNAAAAYFFLHDRFRDRWLALAGAGVFAMSPLLLLGAHHPDIIMLAQLPLGLYFLERGFRGGSWRSTLLAGACLACSLVIGMYIFVCQALTVGLFCLVYASRSWRRRDFWLRLAALGILVGAAAFVRIYPLAADSASLASALGKTGGAERNRDLLGFFVNPANPLTTPLFKGLVDDSQAQLTGYAYLGYVALGLAGLGLARSRERRSLAPWLALLLFFGLLRLGSQLTIGGVAHEQIRLPKYALDQLLPHVFAPFWDMSNFQIGILLPLAVLACAGLKRALHMIAPRRRPWLCVVLLAVMAIEHYQRDEPMLLERESTAFLEWLASEPDQAAIRLIHLPLGRWESKIYGYYQTLSGYPQAEGLASRTPAAAYDFMAGNMLLSRWRRGTLTHCLRAAKDQYLAALDELERAGFSHIALHITRKVGQRIAPGFAAVAPAYADSFTRVYRLDAMRGNCDSVVLDLPADFAFLAPLAASPNLIADKGTALLSFTPAANEASYPVLRDLASAFAYWKSLDQAYAEGGQLALAGALRSQADLPSLLAASQIVVLAYDPRLETGIAELRAALEQDFTPCQRIVDRADASAQYFIRADYACALIDAAASFRVDYGGLRLRNLRYEIGDGRLTVESWWTRLPAEAHGVSIQVFTEAGEKIAGGDIVVNHEPLARHSIDLPATDSDAVSLQLVVYNYASGASLPGELLSSGARFERELEIGTIMLGGESQ